MLALNSILFMNGVNRSSRHLTNGSVHSKKYKNEIQINKLQNSKNVMKGTLSFCLQVLIGFATDFGRTNTFSSGDFLLAPL